MAGTTKPPIWFWIVSILALLWNLAGVGAYLNEAFASDDLLSQMEKVTRDLLQNRPAWATAAFAIAVWGGAIASLFLILRKGLAHILFIISLAGVIVQMIYNYFIAKSIDVYGPGDHSMSIMILGFGIGLVFFAKKGKAKGWLK